MRSEAVVCRMDYAMHHSSPLTGKGVATSPPTEQGNIEDAGWNYGLEDRNVTAKSNKTMEVTKIIYYVGEEDTPYLVKVSLPPGEVRLGDFKSVLPQPVDGYTFFFKSIDEDVGFVKEEICDDDAVLPIHNGRVTSWLVQSFYLRPNITSPFPPAKARRSPSSHFAFPSVKSNAPASPKKIKEVHDRDKQTGRSPPRIPVENPIANSSKCSEFAVEKQCEKKESIAVLQTQVPSLPTTADRGNEIKSPKSSNTVATKSTVDPVNTRHENGGNNTEVVRSIQVLSKPGNSGGSNIFSRLLALSTMQVTTQETLNMSQGQVGGPKSSNGDAHKDLKKEAIKPELNEESWDDPKPDYKPKDFPNSDNTERSNTTKINKTEPRTIPVVPQNLKKQRIKPEVNQESWDEPKTDHKPKDLLNSDNAEGIKTETKTIPVASQAPLKENSSNDPRLKSGSRKLPIAKVTMTPYAPRAISSIPKATAAKVSQPTNNTVSPFPRIPVSVAQAGLKPPYCWGWSLSLPNVVKSDSMTTTSVSAASSSCSPFLPEQAMSVDPTPLTKCNTESEIRRMAQNGVTVQRAQVKKRKSSTSSDKRGASNKRTKVTDGNDEIIVLGA